jgi:uncharacterized membrane protein
MLGFGGDLMREGVLAVVVGVAGVVGSAVGRPAELVVWDPRDDGTLPDCSNCVGVSGVVLLDDGFAAVGNWRNDSATPISEDIAFTRGIFSNISRTITTNSVDEQGVFMPHSYVAGAQVRHRISFSGDVFVVNHIDNIGPNSQSFVWSDSNGLSQLQGLTADGPADVIASAVDASGSWVVGSAGSVHGTQPVLWGPSGQTTPLGTFGGTQQLSVMLRTTFGISANAISRDGNVVVGSAQDADFYQAFRWSRVHGLQMLLGDDPGYEASGAQVISDNERYVSGWVSEESGPVSAFIWSELDGPMIIGALPGDREDSYASWVGDTGVVFGLSYTSQLIVGRRAFVWDRDNGIRELFAAVEALGGDFGDLEPFFVQVTDVDETLQSIAGIRQRETPQVGWIMKLPLPITACNLADHAEPRGALTFADVSAFLNAFVAQEPSADIVAPADAWTFADVNAFLQAFVAGCP